jgi:hypothetical protein
MRCVRYPGTVCGGDVVNAAASPNVAVQWVELVLGMQEASPSNLAPETYYSGIHLVLSLIFPENSAVCRRIPTATSWVRPEIRLPGICGHSNTGDVFLLILLFPLPVLVPPTAINRLIIYAIYARYTQRLQITT